MKKFLKKFLKKILIIYLICLLLATPQCCAKSDDEEELDIKEIVSNEDGSLFDKTIAKTIGGIAQAVYNIATSEELDIGFKSYEDMLFKGGTGTAPFSKLQWNMMMAWYRVFAYISGSLILIAVIIISYKMIASSMSAVKRSEVKENLLHLIFGGVFIGIAPLFIKFLLFLNNTLVNMLVSVVNNGNVNSLLDNEFLSGITTGNPIATALVISMFIYIFVKLNIKFIVREFTLIVFTIFTPIVTGLWIINKNVTAAAIWSGQIMINVFMQFIYCFLFLLFSTFISSTAGWAVTLIWAMMLLPVADVLMNCLQNLTSRIAGLDNNEMSMRGIGLGSTLGGAIGYSIGAIKNSFTNSNNSNTSNGTTFMGRVKNFINPQMNLSPETDYEGNSNPIRNVIEPKKIINKTETTNNQNPIIPKVSNDNINSESKGMKVATGAYKATKAYLGLGARMVEGDFNKNSYKGNVNKNTTLVAQRNIVQKPTIEVESGDDNENEEL